MSNYTTQLRYPIEQRQRDTGTTDYSECYKMLGLDQYPIFDESYRPLLNDKIIDHFYFREIGFETIAQFRFYMRRTMNEEMPYFNQRYLSTQIDINPITNKSYTLDDFYKSLEDTKAKTNMKDHKGGTEDTKTTFDEDEVTKYNKTEHQTEDTDTTDTTTYGKKVNETDTFNKTENETKNYGRTDTTDGQDGGQDKKRAGSTHERDVHSDTPMNQISNGGVEGLNYASDVTYVDKEQNSDDTMTYGKTTHSVSQAGGTDTKNTTTGGNESKETKNSGSDTEVGNVGRVRDTTLGGQDTTSHEGTRDSLTTFDTDETQDTDHNKDVDTTGERHDNWIGYDGVSPADLLTKYRSTFINVDKEVIKALETLFFGLY